MKPPTNRRFRTCCLAAMMLGIAGVAGCDNDEAEEDPDAEEQVLCPQGVFTGETTIRTPDQIADLEGCHAIEGYLGIVCPTCTTLRGLEHIERLSGTLFIWDNPLLEEIDGLSGLRDLDQTSIIISDNPSLRHLKGLSGVTSSEISELQINGNAMLTNLRGLEWLTAVSGGLGIWENPMLTDLQGIEHLALAGEGIAITDNAALQSVTALSGLTETSHLDLDRNPNLTSLAGLENLRRLGALRIESCPQIADLEPLSGLERLGHLTIVDTGITDLDGLDQLTGLDGGGLVLLNNPNLEDISVLANWPIITGLVIGGCPLLSSLTTFANVTITGELSINDMPLLSNLAGLEGATLAGKVDIASNEGLTDLQGLNNIQQASYLYVRDNPNLRTLAGLDQLKLPPNWIEITGNGALQDISVFGGLKKKFGFNSSISLVIEGNAALPACSAEDLAAFITGQRYTLKYVSICDNLEDACGPGECVPRPDTAD